MMMKRVLTILCCGVPLLMTSCGYKIGGLVNGSLEGMKTFDVMMFENQTVHPNVAMQMTTALANALENDGTFRMASSSVSDFCVSGTVTSVSASSLTSDPDDSYISREVGLTVYVDYVITERKTGKVLKKGNVTGSGSYFNTSGNVQAARDAALSSATTTAAQALVTIMTLP